MTNEEKALLDTIAYCEGTLGVSNNGYDVIVGSKNLMANWTTNTTIVHRNMDWYDADTNSTAAGRYQFVYPTWIGGKGKPNLPMTKENQDRRGLELINGRLGKLDKTTLINKNVFFDALNKLAKEWASIPLTKDVIDSDNNVHKAGGSYYSKDGVNKSHLTADRIFEIYKLALSKY